jgi:hypothetical protein
MLKNFIIEDVSQRPISDNTRRDPVAYNSNSSSTTRSRRDNTASSVVTFVDTFPQRSWLSYWYKDKYVVDSIGGTGSFLYIIGSGVNDDHLVSNFFHFVGFFKPKT